MPYQTFLISLAKCFYIYPKNVNHGIEKMEIVKIKNIACVMRIIVVVRGRIFQWFIDVFKKKYVEWKNSLHERCFLKTSSFLTSWLLREVGVKEINKLQHIFFEDFTFENIWSCWFIIKKLFTLLRRLLHLKPFKDLPIRQKEKSKYFIF